MKLYTTSCLASLAALLMASSLQAQEATAPASPAVLVEAEDFTPQSKDGWRTVMNGQGNYMVDIIGFQHISGERVLSAPANARDVKATAKVLIPAAGTFRVWSRFEQPTNCDNRFRVEIRQNGKVAGVADMGERDAPKYFFGSKTPVGQADPSWGSEGLVEQSFDVKGLQAGEVEITLTGLDQSTLTAPANRNVDFLFLTQDLTDSWRSAPGAATLYPILDAAIQAIPTRYYLRLTSQTAQAIGLRYLRNRANWYVNETTVNLEANKPSAWIPLRQQDVTHFTTLMIPSLATGPLQVRAELASDAQGQNILRTIDWNDAKSNSLLVGLPPYPNKYAGEKIVTVEEQYQSVLDYLKAHPSKVGKEPTQPLAFDHENPAWTRGRVGDAAAQLFNAIGMRTFVGFVQPPTLKTSVDIARERFKEWGLAPNRSLAIGKYRFSPTAENIAAAKQAALESGVLPFIQRFDYGDEIAFSEWLSPFSAEDMKARFANWQKQHKGKVEFDTPSSTSATAAANPVLFVDSQRFYEDTAIEYVASQAKAIQPALGSEVLFGANFSGAPFYYPEIAKYIKWFRKTPSGDYAANFGRHSEYFWQLGLPGPLINGYVADHFRAGMRDNPQAVSLQYTMPHSPGNTDDSFRRSAFTHLAHGARGLDYFGIGLNHAFTENYIDFRDPARYAAIRDINRSMATIEDILPTSRVVPSKVALILSDSTEHWDLAGIATDKAGFDVWGGDYKKARLAYHQERLGIYYALVHGSRSPDIVTEEDVQNGILKNYSVAYWVGDCVEPLTLQALDSWVQAGGHLVATAGAFRFDQYQRALPGGLKLLGLKNATLEEKDRFFRPQIEIPRLQPIDFIGEMPALGMRDDITPEAATGVLATFKNGKPAVVERTQGKGKTTYIATLPGVAYLWSAYQPPAGEKYFVPSRGPSSHMPLVNFSALTRQLITQAAQGVLPDVDANGAWIDARLIQSPKGYAIPLANYSPDITEPVTLTIRSPKTIKKITSSSSGVLPLELKPDGTVTIQYVTGLGDILRLE